MTSSPEASSRRARVHSNGDSTKKLDYLHDDNEDDDEDEQHKRIHTAWNDERLNAEAKSIAKINHRDAFKSYHHSSSRVSRISTRSFTTDGILLLVCTIGLYVAGRVNASIFWAFTLSTFALQMLYVRVKEQAALSRQNETPINSSCESTFVNSFIDDIWPRHLYILEERLRISLSARVKDLKTTGISAVRLVSLRIIRGKPSTHSLIGHVELPVSGGTSIRARPSHVMDQVLDGMIDFDGLVEMNFNVQLVVGSVSVRVQITHIQCHSRLRFYNRLDDKPFYGGFTAEVIGTPEPELEFNVKVGYLTATRVPFIEEFFISQLQRLLRSTRVDFALTRSPTKPLKRAEGILTVTMSGVIRSQNCTISAFERRRNRATIVVETACSRASWRATGESNQAQPFVISPWTCDGKGHGHDLQVIIRDAGKEVAKGRIGVNDIVLSGQTTCNEWNVTLRPAEKTFESVKFTLLWEPLLKQRSVEPAVTQKGIELWLNARAGLINELPVGFDMLPEYTGVLRCSVRQVRLAENDIQCGLRVSSDTSVVSEDHAQKSPAVSTSLFEWNPFTSISLGCVSFESKPRGKTNIKHVELNDADVFEFVVDLDAFENSKLVFRLFNRRSSSSSSLIGSAALSLHRIVFDYQSMVESFLELDNGDVGQLEVCVTFQPCVFLHTLGERAEFFAKSHTAKNALDVTVDAVTPHNGVHTSPSKYTHTNKKILRASMETSVADSDDSMRAKLNADNDSTHESDNDSDAESSIRSGEDLPTGSSVSCSVAEDIELTDFSPANFTTIMRRRIAPLVKRSTHQRERTVSTSDTNSDSDDDDDDDDDDDVAQRAHQCDVM